jgi:ribosome hibernation promoting factor
MRIQLKGRGGLAADEELLARVEKKLEKVAKQVSPLAECKIELREERGEQVADGALKLKGVTLRARETGSDAAHAVNLVADDLARQVKKHRDKRRARREAHRAAAQQHAV